MFSAEYVGVDFAQVPATAFVGSVKHTVASQIVEPLGSIFVREVSRKLQSDLRCFPTNDRPKWFNT
jgi:hypothetical protein